MLEIHSFFEPQTGTWTYLLADTKDKIAAIIDPVWSFDPVSGLTDTVFIDQVLDCAQEANLAIRWVLETHAHADHLTAAGLIKQRTGAKTACGKGIRGVQENFCRVFNMIDVPTDGSQFDLLLEEGDTLALGSLEIRVIDTPGHTGDSVTYLVEDAAFIGDTLFSPSFGTARCDFPGGDAGQLYESISRLYQLPTDTRLFLCHDYPKSGDEPVRDVTVAESIRNNIHLNAETDKSAFVSMRTQRDQQLGLPRLILPSLQVNILAGVAPNAESNGVSYLRTPFNYTLADLIKGDLQ